MFFIAAHCVHLIAPCTAVTKCFQIGVLTLWSIGIHWCRRWPFRPCLQWWCQSTYLPGCPIMSFLEYMFGCFRPITLNLCQKEKLNTWKKSTHGPKCMLLTRRLSVLTRDVLFRPWMTDALTYSVGVTSCKLMSLNYITPPNQHHCSMSPNMSHGPLEHGLRSYAVSGTRG